ncbi:unnamed protein product [Microthlaspi erraticum]|uniref:Uncharacterized protein n=1 Tax=Microthlaspi erraticum TaxID=1685480 RepID=A0A6D2KXE1_9BRAS|nr:unnamed protein product [Microthlaspi erraticum]
MDFIKTSSLRALIELTFQRNWNGLIWMSRKGVITKRVKTGPDGSIENQRPNRAAGWPRERFTLGQITSVRLKSRPKFKPPADRITTRETMSRGRPQRSRHAAHDHAARAGKQSLAAAQPSRVPRPMAPSEPGSYVPRPAEKASANLHPSDHSGRPRIRPATTVPIVRAAMTRSSGRSSRPTVRTPRSTRSPF